MLCPGRRWAAVLVVWALWCGGAASAEAEAEAEEGECSSLPMWAESTAPLRCGSGATSVAVPPEAVCDGSRDCASGADERCESLSEGPDDALRCVFLHWPRFRCRAAVCLSGDMVEGPTGALLAHLVCRRLGLSTYRRFGWIDRTTSNGSAVAAGVLSCTPAALSPSDCLFRPTVFSRDCPRYFALSCRPDCRRKIFIPRNASGPHDLVSQGYPSLTLPDSTCSWSFVAEEPNVAIAFRFVSLNFHETPSSPGRRRSCTNSRLSIGLGRFPNDSDAGHYDYVYRKRSFCHLDDLAAQTLFTSEPKAWLKYHSGRYLGPLDGPQGFRLQYWTVPCNQKVNGTYCFASPKVPKARWEWTAFGVVMGCLGAAAAVIGCCCCRCYRRDRVRHLRSRGREVSGAFPGVEYYLARVRRVRTDEVRPRGAPANLQVFKGPELVVETRADPQKRLATQRPKTGLRRKAKRRSLSVPQLLPLDAGQGRERGPGASLGEGAVEISENYVSIMEEALPAPWDAPCQRCLDQLGGPYCAEAVDLFRDHNCQHQRAMKTWLCTAEVSNAQRERNKEYLTEMKMEAAARQPRSRRTFFTGQGMLQGSFGSSFSSQTGTVVSRVRSFLQKPASLLRSSFRSGSSRRAHRVASRLSELEGPRTPRSQHLSPATSRGSPWWTVSDRTPNSTYDRTPNTGSSRGSAQSPALGSAQSPALGSAQSALGRAERRARPKSNLYWGLRRLSASPPRTPARAPASPAFPRRGSLKPGHKFLFPSPSTRKPSGASARLATPSPLVHPTVRINFTAPTPRLDSPQSPPV